LRPSSAPPPPLPTLLPLLLPLLLLLLLLRPLRAAGAAAGAAGAAGGGAAAGAAAGAAGAGSEGGCPQGCQCLDSPATLSCPGANKMAVPRGIAALGARRVFLQGNHIGRLERGEFGDQVLTLWLHSNNLSRVDSEAFRGLSRLEELDLGANPALRSLPVGALGGLRSLTALHLYRCGLAQLPTGLFDDLEALRFLYLQ
uniref:Reticulon-4 receptor-like 1 n=1 Tax=Petromyzon marinus TaxID=7757 RepID=A0AAJ7SK64_PETMA